MVKLGSGTVTVSVVEPEIESDRAAIVVVPADIPVARPCEIFAFETVATDVLVDDHVQIDVRS